MLETNKIYCMDCLEGLKQLDDDSIDFCLTDPPYNIKLKYDVYKDNISKKDFWKFIEHTFNEIYRVLKPKAHLTFTCAQKQVWQYKPMLESMGFIFRHMGVWHNPKRKAGSWPGQWPYSWEPILDFTKGGFRKLNNRNGVGYMDVWNESPPKNISHPASRPVKCWTDLLLLCTNEGELVLDPFCGSGTTSYVAKKNGRNYICFEISPKYCEDSRLRVKYIQTDLINI